MRKLRDKTEQMSLGRKLAFYRVKRNRKVEVLLAGLMKAFEIEGPQRKPGIRTS